MLEKHQRLCIWAGAAFVPIFAVVFISIGWLPPPSPNMTAAETGEMFAEHSGRIRLGMWVLTTTAPLLCAYGAALTHLTRRVIGLSPLVWLQAICAACLIFEFIIPQQVWQVATFRAGRDNELVQMLNDQAWLVYLGVAGTVMVQMTALAVCILQDDRQVPLVPRWVAYANLSLVLGVVSGSLIVFAKTGPIAWNGAISWWLVAVSFFLWVVVMVTVMLRASHRLEREDAAAAALV